MWSRDVTLSMRNQARPVQLLLRIRELVRAAVYKHLAHTTMRLFIVLLLAVLGLGPRDPACCRAGQVQSHRGEEPLDREASVLCRGPMLPLHFCPGRFLGTKLHGRHASGERHLTCQPGPSLCFQTCPLGSCHS